MDLIDEHDRPLFQSGTCLGLLHHFPNLFDPAADRTEIDEGRLRLLRDDPGQRRLPDARRPPEDHGRHHVIFDQLPQDPSFAQQMLLTDIVLQRPGPHAVCQRFIHPCMK